MKKLLIIVTLLAMAILPLRSEIVIKVGGQYNFGFNFNDYEYIKSWSYQDWLDSREFNQTVFDGSGFIGLNAGIAMFFTYSLGVGVDFSVSLKSANFDLNPSYQWNWTWGSGTTSEGKTGSVSRSAGEEGEWEVNSGKVNVIPISLNLYYRLNITDSFKLNFSAGPTFYLCAIELTSNYAKAINPWLDDEGYINLSYYPDYIIEADVSQSVFGGNISIEMDVALSDFLQFFFGGRYYIAGKISDIWQIRRGRYLTNDGQFYNPQAEQNAIPLEDYTWELSISSFTFVVGIKLTI